MSAIVTTSRLPIIESSIFARMSRIAVQFNAVNLSQGYPDFPPDERLIEALFNAVQSNYNQYSLSEGTEALRVAISKMFTVLYSMPVDPVVELTVTVGATQAIFATVSSLVHTGDEVIFFQPAFECYMPAIMLAGGIPTALQLHGPTFLPDWDEVEQAITERTRMIIINSPHNPTGACWLQADARRLGELADKYGFIVLSDEVYHNILFEQQEHVTVFSEPRLRERAVVVGSLSKIMHVTGWRIGYAIASAALTAEIRKVHQFQTYAAPTPLQYAIAEILNDSNSYLALSKLFARKRDLFLDGLQDSRFKWLPTRGGYFQLLDYSAISNEADSDFANRLITDFNIAAIPLSSFSIPYQETRLLRFCFAKKDETLLTATAILRTV